MAFIGFALIAAGAFLIYSGVKGHHPYTLTQQAIKGGTISPPVSTGVIS